MRIYKYELYGFGINEIHMQQGSKVLSVDEQDGRRVLWAMRSEWTGVVPTVIHRFYVAPTGYSVPEEVAEEGTFIGTVTCRDRLVIHVFDLGEGNEVTENSALGPLK